jgi:hypothetical protein
MTSIASQVHCPFCNAAQVPQASGGYTCDFCLQPFSVHDAQREEARMLDEIKAWVEQRVGAAGPASGVDSASRAYIFQQKVLPDLRRDVDRALERLGGYGQFPLITAPVRSAIPTSNQLNPLVAYRREILGLKSLKARLASEDVSSFVARDADKLVIRFMDRHLSSLMHLSNVAHAAASRTVDGYAAARRNLEVLADDVAQSVTTEGAQDPALGAFLSALHARFGALGEMCRLCEEAGSPNAISGAALADRAVSLATSLGETAQKVEACNYSPADSMPVVVALHQEAASARTLERWLRAYDHIVGHSQVAFPSFVAEIDPMTGGGEVAPEAQAELLEALGFVLGAARGAAPVPVVSDFSWVGAWAEAGRQKKTLGMFGVDEKVAEVDQFLAPFWAADLSFSRTQGGMFVGAQEQRAVVVVDACAPSPTRVLVVGAGPVATALESPGMLAGAPVAMPRSGPTHAAAVMMQGLQRRPEYMNPRLRMRGLVFLPAVVATYTGGPRPRTVTSCLSDQVPVDVLARANVQTTQHLLQRYG